MPAPKTTPVPIRFDTQVRERLQAVSADCGLSVSDLCRLAVEKLLTELETTGQITLRVSEEVSGYTTKKDSGSSRGQKAKPKPKSKAKAKKK